MLPIPIHPYLPEPHRSCNGGCACLECGRSWIRVSIESTKDYKIGVCYFSAKHAALGRKSKDWLVRNQDMFKWGDMSIRGLLFQRASTIKIQLSVFV
jgi:hypothetical protein